MSIPRIFRKLRGLVSCKLYHFHRVNYTGTCVRCWNPIFPGYIAIPNGLGEVWIMESETTQGLLTKRNGHISKDVLRFGDMPNKGPNLDRLQTILYLREELGKSFREIGRSLNISHVAAIYAYRNAVRFIHRRGLTPKTKRVH